jgi:hypothetical protein
MDYLPGITTDPFRECHCASLSRRSTLECSCGLSHLEMDYQPSRYAYVIDETLLTCHAANTKPHGEPMRICYR